MRALPSLAGLVAYWRFLGCWLVPIGPLAHGEHIVGHLCLLGFVYVLFRCFILGCVLVLWCVLGWSVTRGSAVSAGSHFGDVLLAGGLAICVKGRSVI